MFSIVNIIAAVIAAVLGAAAGLPCCIILNKIPAKWLCDYDEEPTQELLSGDRYTFKRHGIPLGIALGIACGASVLTNGFSVEMLIALVNFFVLALVAGADAKYTIIPDQFTIAAAVLSAGFAVTDLLTKKCFLTKWYEPLIGAAVGGGALILLDLFSMFVLKKEGFGFGDIKLLAALGLMFGWKYTIVLLIAASFIAAVHFLVIIFSKKNAGKEGVYLPMGPYLCIGAAVTVISQPWFGKIFDLYKVLLEMEALP